MATQTSQADIYQLLANYQLGTPEIKYETRLSLEKLFYGLIYFALPFVVIGSIFLIHKMTLYTLLIGGVISIVSLGSGIHSLLLLRLNRNLSLYICTYGLLRLQGDKKEVMYWDEIESVWQKIARRYRFTIYVGKTHIYMLHSSQGKLFKFDDYWVNIEKLGETISQQAARYLLPKAVMVYQNGNVVDFGPLHVSQQGISNGKMTLPWHDIKGVEVSDKYIIVKHGTNAASWAPIDIASIPNALVFTELIDCVARGTI